MPEPIKFDSQWWEKLKGFIRGVPEDKLSFLSASTGLMAIAAVYLYFAGYIFSFFFYKSFGVNLESLDLSSQYYFIHAFTVFRTYRGLLLLIMFLLIAYGYSVAKIRLEILLASLVVAFPILFFTSYDIALEESDLARRHPQSSIELRFKSAANPVQDISGADVPANVLVKLGKDGYLHSLWETKDRIIFFYQALPVQNALPAVEVYTVSRSDIEWSVVTGN